jgi:predicted dehydrogenase
LRRHRVLIIGVGSIGERHLRCFQATDRADVSFVEVSPDLRRTIAERYGVERPFADLEAAIGDREPPEVAVVATPAPTHVPIATTLAEAGIHVLIEKPLSTRLSGLDRLEAAVERAGVVAGVAYVYRAHPVLQGLRRVIAGGKIGRPVELVAVAGQNFPTYRPAYRSTYYTDHATGGGAIQDALTHVINAGEWLVGPVARVVADADHCVLDGVTVEDTAHVLARHGDEMGVLASYSLNQHQAANEVTLTVVGDRGIARAELHENRWRWMTTPGDAWHDETIDVIERDTVFLAQAHGFLDAVERRGDPACTLAEGVQTLRVNLAALASVAARGWRTIAEVS